MAKNIGTLALSASSYQERSQASRLVDSWSEETALELQATTARVKSEVTALQGQEKTINADAGRSDIGKFDLVRIAVQDFITRLRWLRDLKGTLETRCGNVYGNLFILKPSTRNEIVQGLRDAAIVSVIGPLPQDQRDVEYLKASEADNTEVLRALSDAPMPLVTDEVRLRGDDQRAAKLQPQRYLKFVETGELLREVSAILDDCLDLGREFGIDVKENINELGPKMRVQLDFAIEHVGGRGKKVLRTSQRDGKDAA